MAALKGFIPLVFITFFGFITLLKAQNGQIEGVVTDSRTTEALVGAQILIDGTTRGAITNFDGEFIIQNLEDGVYVLYISYISYEPLYIDEVLVENGKSLNLDIQLRPVNIEISGTTVTARRATHSEIAVLNTIRSGGIIASGISSQQISRSQDSDAAEVVRRVPGVTVMDNRFIIIRGLSERYNPVRLHSMAAPSMEPDVRSFSFDMIPSSQIDRLMVFKSPSPELPGDFGGGVVQIFTRSIPENTGMRISYSSGYVHGTSFNSFMMTRRDPMSWAGTGERFFKLPSDFPDDIRSISNNPDLLTETGRSLDNSVWVPEQMQAYPDQSISLSGSLRFQPGSFDIGNITTFYYGNSLSANQITRSDYNAYNHQQDQSLPIYNFNDQQYNNNIKIGLLHNWGIQYRQDHTIEVVNLFNHISSYRYVNRLGDHLDFGFTMNNHSFQQIFRGLYTGQLTGRHKISGDTELDWFAGLNTSSRNMPDYRQFRSERPINDPEGDYFNIYVPIGGAQPYFMGRFYSAMDERGNAYGVNIRHKLRISSGFQPEIRAGYYHDYLERDFRARNIGYTQSVGFEQGLRSVSVDSLFHHDNINNFGGIKLDEQSNPQDSYNASNYLDAYYLSFYVPAGKLDINAGLRLEDNHRKLNSATTTGPVEIDKKQMHFLPSVNLTYNVSGELLLRAAYGHTLNRPEFRENAPFGFYDFDYNYVVTGFPYLETATIRQYDIRGEYYPTISEVISISFFYKDFHNAIEKVFLPGAGSGGAKNFSFGNAESARVYGGELELRKSLEGLTGSGIADDLYILLNGTLLTSSVNIGGGSRSQGRDTDPRPLQGQSPYIVNAGVFYDNQQKGVQFNILYNIIGERIYSGGFRELDGETLSYPDVYELPRGLLDLTFTKALGGGFLLKAGASDILNSPVVLIQDGNEDGRLDTGSDQLLQYYRPGVKVSIGVQYSLN